MKTVKRIVCVDGGGMRGLIPATVLADWERASGKRLWGQVDMTYGVSIGGIITLLLASGCSMEDALAFFAEDGPKIFAKGWWHAFSLFGLMAPKYNAQTLELALQRRFAGKRLSDCRVPAGTYALDVRSGDPFFFKSHDFSAQDNFQLWQAARATSAAQTYFASSILRNASLWDGGNLNNNPSAFALADAFKLWGDEVEVRVLSLGCGMDAGNVHDRSLHDAGLIEAGLATINLMFEADSAETDYQMRQVLGAGYFRCQPRLSKALALDDASPRGLSWLRENAGEASKQFAPVLAKFFGP